MAVLSKNELRAQIRQLRNRCTDEERLCMDEAVFNKLLNYGPLREAAVVYLYVSLPHETDTRRLIRYLLAQGVRVAVPRVCGSEIFFYRISSWEDLSPGSMGILEPSLHLMPEEETEAPVIVPGLAFDPYGSRLGYGGGYYDRFFAREPNHHKIGIAYDFQIVPLLETECFDVKVDRIITPEHII